MTFTNISGRSIYLQCCHREVEPRGTFVVPWGLFKGDRGLRAAMSSGDLAWTSAPGEPEVPGSPKLPTPEEQARLDEARKAAARKRQDEADRAVAERKARDDRAVSANMARMGRFKVPRLTPHRKADYGAKREAPVTRADLIRDDKPQSLAAIVRHNKAIRIIERAKGGDAGDAGDAGRRENENENKNQNSNQESKEQ